MNESNERANPLRGEITLTGESGNTYTFRLGMNALARMQKALEEKTIKQLLERLQRELNGEDFDSDTIRIMVQAASTQNISEDQAGDLVDDCGLAVVLRGITDSLNQVFTRGGAANPRKGSARTKTS